MRESPFRVKETSAAWRRAPRVEETSVRVEETSVRVKETSAAWR